MVAIEVYCVEIHSGEKERRFLILVFAIEQIQTCAVYFLRSHFLISNIHMDLPIVAFKYK